MGEKGRRVKAHKGGSEASPSSRAKRTRKRKPRHEVTRNMAAIRARENRSEVLLRKSLFALGFRYRKYDRDLPGRPDIVFRRERVAVFVDGDYWHGRLLRERGVAAVKEYFRRDQHSYWIAKLQRNVDRDNRATGVLEALGWKVVRIWESSVKSDLVGARDRVAAAVTARRKASRGLVGTSNTCRVEMR